MAPYFTLATRLEKFLEQICGRRFGEPSIDLRPVMAAR
jgi:hypothetical protein